MILGYKQITPWGELTSFATKIVYGRKKHTLRADPNNRWKAGMKIQHALGVRTKKYVQFAEGECKSVQKIIIEEGYERGEYSYNYFFEKRKVWNVKRFRVKVDGKSLRRKEIDILARNDGFETTDDLFRWFINGFEGKIIHFTNLRY
ncbi:MAG: hypothetical protein ACOYN4_05630 [Bacteroidales bacterium]